MIGEHFAVCFDFDTVQFNFVLPGAKLMRFCRWFVWQAGGSVNLIVVKKIRRVTLMNTQSCRVV